MGGSLGYFLTSLATLSLELERPPSNLRPENKIEENS